VSSIVLSGAVRQNLLSLQSTADLLATTQTRLSSGKRVNSALENPTNFFTASALEGRASDINNLLDSIGNGVQVLQAANTGISQLEKLVGNAKSVANQALQTTVGYSTKSTVTSAAITGATANNLLGDIVSTGVVGAAANAKDSTANTLLTTLWGAALSDSIATDFAAADTITVNGTVLTFVASGATENQLNVTDTIGTLLSRIDQITGATTASTIAANGAITLQTGTAANLVITSSNAAAYNSLGFTGGGSSQVLQNSLPDGQTLTIGATGGGTATGITFGTAANEVNTLDELNAALAGNNLQATISAAGAITITTSNDAASATIGAIAGTSTAAGQKFNGLTASAPVQDAAAQLTRAGLVTQYNNIIQQISNTAQDASYAGVNLLGRDTLKLVFNETATSTLTITGVSFDSAGLGLTSLAAGTDFIDNNATSKVLATLSDATVTLRSQASALGSNLSIVQTRQDFSKAMVVVLQTGSSNLTLADTNEEAANSQALSTRQSIAVSALALANQSQQSVLQLLR
jgi:flagellin-like hook-associated protein FlgL